MMMRVQDRVLGHYVQITTAPCITTWKFLHVWRIGRAAGITVGKRQLTIIL